VRTPGCDGAPPNYPPMFEISHSGTQSIVGGPVYRGNPYPNSISGDVSFPLSYEGVYFASEYFDDFLRARRWDPGTSAWVQISGDLGAENDFATGLGGGSSDWAVGPDGALYYVSQDDAKIYKIVYTAADFDRDGVLDIDDLDDDNDGLTDIFETVNGYIPKDTDTDDDGIMDGLDPSPDTQNNDCMGLGDTPTFSTVVSTDMICAAKTSITVQGTVEVQANKLLLLMSQHVELQPNFNVDAMGGLSIFSVDPGAVAP
jgi:hypothetical protein